MMTIMMIGDTYRVLGDDGDPASQFAQTKLGDVHLGQHHDDQVDNFDHDDHT